MMSEQLVMAKKPRRTPLKVSEAELKSRTIEGAVHESKVAKTSVEFGGVNSNLRPRGSNRTDTGFVLSQLFWKTVCSDANVASFRTINVFRLAAALVTNERHADHCVVFEVANVEPMRHSYTRSGLRGIVGTNRVITAGVLDRNVWFALRSSIT